MSWYTNDTGGPSYYLYGTPDSTYPYTYHYWTPVEKPEEPKPVVINININATIILKIEEDQKEKFRKALEKSLKENKPILDALAEYDKTGKLPEEDKGDG